MKEKICDEIEAPSRCCDACHQVNNVWKRTLLADVATFPDGVTYQIYVCCKVWEAMEAKGYNPASIM